MELRVCCLVNSSTPIIFCFDMHENNTPLVAYSHDIFTSQIAGGVTRCMIELMRSITDLGLDWTAWAGKNGNQMLSDTLSEPWARGNINSAPGPHRGRVISSITQESSFANWLTEQSPAVVHRTYYPILDMADAKFARVETLHDLWDERPGNRTENGAKFRSFIKKRACHQADAVVCVSEHTRNDAIERWPSLINKFKVIPHGVRPLSAHPIQPTVARPYFLFVGRRGLYKNFKVVAAALAQSGLDHGLICFGGGAFSKEEQAMLATFNILDRTEQITGSDHQLAGLYMKAAALLYPSSFEGFGLPLLEAMIHDCPVITSPLTSLPEVGGNAALYADPQFPEAWANAMKNIVEDPSLARDLRDLGKYRAAEFSWSRSAELHRKLYNSLA